MTKNFQYLKESLREGEISEKHRTDFVHCPFFMKINTLNKNDIFSVLDDFPRA